MSALSQGSSPEFVELRSPNGRRLACEPCRKRKLRCDNQVPVCQRCQRSKNPRNCFYGSPMPLKSSRSSVAKHPILPSIKAATSKHAARTVTGYLGATSLSNLLHDHQDSSRWPFQALSLPDCRPVQPGHSALAAPESLSRHKLGIALDILGCIPDPETANLFMSRNKSPVDGWLRPAIVHMSDSLFATFEPHVKSPETPGGLKHMLEVLCQNSREPLEEGQDSSTKWLASFSGLNIRWEGLGLLFVHWAVGAMQSPSNHLHGTNPDGVGSNKCIASTYLDCVGSCLDLTDWRHGGSLLLLSLLLKYAHVLDAHHGDANLRSGQIHSQAVTVAVSLGLHVTARSAIDTVSLSSQIRRRLFAHLYIIDKSSAILTGRPPLLSHRYCSTPLPLDMSDDMVLALEGSTVVKGTLSKYKIDKNGWNINSLIYSSTLMRARLSMAHIREDILEMALGSGEAPNVERLRSLKSRQESLYDRLPAVLLHSSHKASRDAVDARSQTARTLTQLEHLQNLFFITRMLAKADQLPSDAHALVKISSDMLRTTFALWTAASGPSVAFDWLVVSYACPAAGVLCSELLQPDALLLRPGEISCLRRSDVVQQLSLLCGFLSSIGSGAPNASLWTTVKDVISRVLEQTLNAPPTTSLPSLQNDDVGYGVDFFSDLLISDDFGDMFAFELLDTFEWLRHEAP